MKNFAQQFIHFWSKLGLNQRVSLSVMAAAVGLLVIGVIVWSRQVPMALLYGRLDPKDMQEVVNLVESNGLPYRLEQGGTAIYIPSPQVAKLRMELASQGVPNGGGIGFEIFDRTNFGLSDFVQRTNYLRAIQGELSRTIAQLQGVRSARVMIVLPENRLLVNNEKSKATASVFIDTGGLRLGHESVESIRFLVSNSVEGLLPEDVAVVDHRGHVLSSDLQDQNAGMGGHIKMRQNIESYLSQKVEGLLAKALGPDSVVARVSVDLDMDTVTRRELKFDPDGQVVRTQTQVDDNTLSSESKPMAVPTGVAANGPAGAQQPQPQVAATASPAHTSQQSHKNKTLTYEINQVTLETARAPGDIRGISAAVFVAVPMVNQQGKMTPQPRTPQQLAKIKEMVANALGGSINGNPIAVTVEETLFSADAYGAQTEKESALDRMTPWIEPAKSFFAVIVGLLAVFMFIKIIKKAKTQSVAFEVLEDK
ncbi:MAG TPA: flagellar basal-body MS-ring/collar protein FliF, partial [Opitutales bacterium]|nr:flagellar basal-body MS-ring/collar protein FliF [Opitutales bacterium]